MSRRARLVLPLLGALALTGCGGGPSARGVIDDTAARLGKIRSGTLDLRLVLHPRAGTGSGDIGFTLRGPFAFGSPGSLPVLRVTYTQLAGPRQASATLVSDGRTAYADADGRRVALSDAQVRELRGATSSLASSGGLAQLPLDDWVANPDVSDGGDVGGASTDRVSADLDVVNAANGLIDLVRAFGRDLPRISGAQADRLRSAVRHSSFDLWTGKRDRLLRRLRITADLGLDVPEELRRALGSLVGARLEFQLGVANPNERR